MSTKAELEERIKELESEASSPVKLGIITLIYRSDGTILDARLPSPTVENIQTAKQILTYVLQALDDKLIETIREETTNANQQEL